MKLKKVVCDYSKGMSIMKKFLVLLVAVVLMSMLTGCTNWKKEYEALDVEKNNLAGRLENCLTGLDSAAKDKASMGIELSKSQRQIADLQKQIEDMGQRKDSGFEGVGDVSYDPEAGTITVALPNAILFTAGKASLKKSTISELDQIRAVLRERYSGKEVDVVGHTDSDPIVKSKKFWEDNWELSAQRALSVLRYMVDHGVNAEQIRAVAAGASRPVASNSSASGKAKNRRVEIVVHMR